MQEFLVSVKYAVDATSQRSFLDTLKQVAKSVGGMTALAGAAATAFVAMTHAMAEAGERLYFMSMRMNESADNIKAAVYAMSQFGMSTEEAAGQLEAFGRFERLGGPAATAWLQFLGVTATGTRERLQQLGPALARMGGVVGQQGTLGYSLALRAAGRMGIGEAGMLDLTSGDYAQRSAEFDRIMEAAGLSMDAYARHSHDLMVSFRQLGMVYEAVQTAFAGRLLVGLNIDLKQLNDLLQADLPFLASAVRLFADVMVFFAHSVTSMIIGVHDLMALVNLLPNSLKLVAGAFAVFGSSLVRSPVFWFAAAIIGLLVLLDDFQTFQRGGDTLLDWSWAKGIDRFLKDTAGLKGGFGDLILIAVAAVAFFGPISRMFVSALGLLGFGGAGAGLRVVSIAARGLLGIGLLPELGLLLLALAAFGWLSSAWGDEGGTVKMDWLSNMLRWLGMTGDQPAAAGAGAAPGGVGAPAGTAAVGGGGGRTGAAAPAGGGGGRAPSGAVPGNIPRNAASATAIALRDHIARALHVSARTAAAIASNFMAESGGQSGINELQPLIPGSRGGFGLAQWTASRRRDLEAFAEQRGLDVRLEDTQLLFLQWELATKFPRLLAQMEAAGSAQEAGAIFFRGYESGGAAMLEKQLPKHLAWVDSLTTQPLLPSPQTMAEHTEADGVAPIVPGRVRVTHSETVRIAPPQMTGSTANPTDAGPGRSRENLVRDSAGSLR
jgi:hypothetical protein